MPLNLMSNNNNFPMAPDDAVRHTSKRVAELRSALANAYGLIQVQQARINELERLALPVTIQVLEKASTDSWPRRDESSAVNSQR